MSAAREPGLSASPRVLVARPLEAAAFAPYGTVIGAPAGHGRLINAGTTERFDIVDDLRLAAEGGRATLAVYRAQARSFPFVATELERHALGSQTFVPLGEHRFLIVVATAGDAPEAVALVAFISDGRQGVTLAPGTWHHALLSVEAAEFAVIERGAPEVDCVTCELASPISIELPRSDA